VTFEALINMSRWKQQLGGLFIALIGAGFTAWTWRTALNELLSIIIFRSPLNGSHEIRILLFPMEDCDF